MLLVRWEMLGTQNNLLTVNLSQKDDLETVWGRNSSFINLILQEEEEEEEEVKRLCLNARDYVNFILIFTLHLLKSIYYKIHRYRVRNWYAKKNCMIFRL
jgi:hypothetical protein